MKQTFFTVSRYLLYVSLGINIAVLILRLFVEGGDEIIEENYLGNTGPTGNNLTTISLPVMLINSLIILFSKRKTKRDTIFSIFALVLLLGYGFMLLLLVFVIWPKALLERRVI